DDFLKEMATVAASLERKSERPPPPDITRAANAIGEADAFAVLARARPRPWWRKLLDAVLGRARSS
ncbi:MAG: hypothetical protein IT379_15205, partial [Deltaproteobacteria bacterium]|nr:hypothetical protein [Deltaproteobacteria bacterium]